MSTCKTGGKCFLVALVLSVVLVAGCGHEKAIVPSIVSTSPAQGATGLAVSTTVGATFSMAMNPATLTPATFTVTGPGGTAVSGAVTITGSVATFTPAAVLAYNTQYTAMITTAAASMARAHLVGNHMWTFTTITPPPTIVSASPANGAINVPVSQVLSATFSEAMTPATISASTFGVTGPGGTAVVGAVTYSGVTAVFTPAAALAFNAVYTATITTGVKSVAGTQLAANYVWTLTTVTPPPAVIATVPLNTSTGVPLNPVLRASFNESLNCSTLVSPAATFIVTGPGTNAVAGTIGCAAAITTFTPAASLAVNTVYTATITTGVQNLDGIPMVGNYVWTFRTVPAATAPKVIATVPINLATGVPINQTLTATFSEAMNGATIDGAALSVTAPGGVAVAGTVSYVAGGSVAVFVPTANLAAGTVYTATITTGATDLEGTALLSNFSWTFTTGLAADTTQPTVVSTVPVDAATGVDLNQAVSASFSKAMNPASMDSSTFTVTGPGGSAVSGLVGYAVTGNTATFTPSANLAATTVYTATITTAARDLAANALASNYVWSFTTGTALNSSRPEVMSTIPANTAINVPLNQAVSATFDQAMDPLTFTTATFQLSQGGVPVDVTVAYNPLTSIATITPMTLLTSNTTYTATVTNGATNLAGNPLGNAGVPNPWMFNTGSLLVQDPVNLGSAAVVGGFGGTAGVTNMGIHTVINGNIGTTAVSTLITGFHDNGPNCVYTETPLNVGHVNGAIDTAPPSPTVGCPNEGTAVTAAIAAKAALDALSAYNALVAFPNGLDVSVCPGCGGGGAGELGNRTLASGIYKAAPGSYSIAMGDLTLDAKGDPNAVWVFQMAKTLTVGTPTNNRSVLLVNGAQAKNVFWQVGSAATINGILGGGTMQGTIIAQEGVSISTAGVDAITTINGRALVLTGPVTMVNTVINVPAP